MWQAWLTWLVTATFAQTPPNVVLISMDTTRADALSCYGTVPGAAPDRPPTTPHADALAQEGVRFEHFLAHAPTTLSSHASMFTGHDPHQHAVVRNGYPLASEHQTLAERLRDSGWDTLAVVGSTALEAAMGLDQGFRTYDDELSALSGRQFQDRADAVVDRALKATDQRQPDKPVFLFVHFFDAHMPYDAPGEWRDRYTDPAYTGPWRDQINAPVKDLIRDMQQGRADPAHPEYITGRYLGEVAWVDHQIGRLLEGLKQRGLLDNTLVILTADHGETLTEEPFFAWSHGSDVSLGSMRVPLIIRGFGVPLARGRIATQQAGMNGLAPTIEQLVGLKPTLGSGFAFYDVVRPGPVSTDQGWPHRPVRPVFVEATRPLPLEPQTGWNNRTFFRGLWAGGWGVYLAPVYDEDTTFYGPPSREGHLALINVMEGQMHAWNREAPPHQEPSPGPRTQEALRALGYLSDPD